MNPYLIIAVILAITGAGVTGYLKGEKDATNAAVAAQKKAVDDAITQHNEDSVIDMTAAYERGKAEAKVRVVTRTIQGEASAISASSPIPVSCKLDPKRRLLLDKAIVAANNENATTGVPSDLPANNKPAVR